MGQQLSRLPFAPGKHDEGSPSLASSFSSGGSGGRPAEYHENQKQPASQLGRNGRDSAATSGHIAGKFATNGSGSSGSGGGGGGGGGGGSGGRGGSGGFPFWPPGAKRGESGGGSSKGVGEELAQKAEEERVKLGPCVGYKDIEKVGQSLSSKFMAGHTVSFMGTLGGVGTWMGNLTHVEGAGAVLPMGIAQIMSPPVRMDLQMMGPMIQPSVTIVGPHPGLSLTAESAFPGPVKQNTKLQGNFTTSGLSTSAGISWPGQPQRPLSRPLASFSLVHRVPSTLQQWLPGRLLASEVGAKGEGGVGWGGAAGTQWFWGGSAAMDCDARQPASAGLALHFKGAGDVASASAIYDVLGRKATLLMAQKFSDRLQMVTQWDVPLDGVKGGAARSPDTSVIAWYQLDEGSAVGVKVDSRGGSDKASLVLEMKGKAWTVLPSIQVDVGSGKVHPGMSATFTV